VPAVPAARPIRGVPPLLTWVSEYTRPAGFNYLDLPDSKSYGSISGITPDPGSNQLVGVIDDRDNTRIAWLSFVFANNTMTVTPTRVTPLRAGPGVTDAVAAHADLEAIAAKPDGTFLMAEEGHETADGIWQPAILHVTRDGVVTHVTSFPGEFTMRADHKRGVRDNQGIESLTRLPNGNLIAGLEQPLIQDGPPATFDRGGRGRLIEFAPRQDGGYAPRRQWWYPIERTPRIQGYDDVCSDGENGLVELLAISNTELFAMERACLIDKPTGNTANAIRLFAIEISRREVRKTMALDLSTLKLRLSPALARLENFEGMSFGPTSTTGVRTLLLVSDDNFRPTQKTSFLLFGIRSF
jgi:hypothetical protein